MLEVASCSGPFCIACALPALKVDNVASTAATMPCLMSFFAARVFILMAAEHTTGKPAKVTI